MAPGVCMTNFPIPRTDAAYPYTAAYPRRRQRNRFVVGIVGKYRTVEMRQMSLVRARVGSPHDATPSSFPISLPDTSIDANCQNNDLASSLSTRISIEQEEQWISLKRRAGLLNIIARTLDLVRRNHILEKKVEALRLETQSFVKSVNDNPENSLKNTRRRDPTSCLDTNVADSMSSTTDEKSFLSMSVVKNNEIEESRRNICDNRDDQSFAKSNLERDTRDSDTMLH